jgi:hypothetical protein
VALPNWAHIGSMLGSRQFHHLTLQPPGSNVMILYILNFTTCYITIINTTLFDVTTYYKMLINTAFELTTYYLIIIHILHNHNSHNVIWITTHYIIIIHTTLFELTTYYIIIIHTELCELKTHSQQNVYY